MPVMTTYSRRLRRKTPELTTDILLHHIAPRLPAKSVLRLMAVCKEFHSFLKSHQFAKMHLPRVINDNRHKFLVLLRDSEREGGTWLFSSIDRETTPPSGVTRPSRRVPFLAPDMKVLASFHGLVCVGIRLQVSTLEYSDLILWNPTTGDYKILTKTNVVIGGFDGFGLYYTSCDDDYKLIHLTKRCEVYQYSLRFDSWRKLQVGFARNSMHHCWWIPSVWLNENLYFLGESNGHTIMRFDTITENFTVMKLPPPLGGRRAYPFSVSVPCKRLFVHEGYIHLCVKFEGSFYRNVKFDTWMMNEDGDWSMVNTYNMYKQDPLDCKRRSHLIRNGESHLMRNGEWLMIHRPKRSYRNHILYMFDPEKKVYTYIYAYTGLNNSMSIPEGGRYTETLVSPNQYVLA